MDGLTEDAAERSRREYGRNVVVRAQHSVLITTLVISEPMFLLLVAWAVGLPVPAQDGEGRRRSGRPITRRD
ncbi:cation-transporting P-type ATPase [Deinococcus rubellus]|uniref:cation-transporting P-type ATPase n=1 Tax=Deinococcus rubellus TaxID=1889240 RepID=UPI003CD086E6